MARKPASSPPPGNRQVRIIGGELKRRLVAFNAVEGLRPTPDRVRETLFNWLMWELGQKDVIDLCSGSGILGIEALSRGARHCTFIEADRSQATCLTRQLELLGIPSSRYQVLNMTAQDALKKLNDRIFNLAFLDPPYSKNLWAELAAAVNPLMSPDGLIYVEADQPPVSLDLPRHWHPLKQARAGQVFYGLYQNAVVPAPASPTPPG